MHIYTHIHIYQDTIWYILFCSLLSCESSGSNLDPFCGGLRTPHGGKYRDWEKHFLDGRGAVIDIDT